MCCRRERHSFPNFKRRDSHLQFLFGSFRLSCSIASAEAFILQRHYFFNFKRRDIQFPEALISMNVAEALVSILFAEALLSIILFQSHAFCRGTHFHQFNCINRATGLGLCRCWQDKCLVFVGWRHIALFTALHTLIDREQRYPSRGDAWTIIFQCLFVEMRQEKIALQCHQIQFVERLTC